VLGWKKRGASGDRARTGSAYRATASRGDRRGNAELSAIEAAKGAAGHTAYSITRQIEIGVGAVELIRRSWPHDKLLACFDDDRNPRHLAVAMEKQ
jgi:hypothetical protein